VTTYYVDRTNGNNNNSGTSEGSPWQTVSKVTNTNVSGPDNRVLFKCGEVWREPLTTNGTAGYAQGTAGHPVIFGAYGSGAKPRFILSIDLSADRSPLIDWTETSPGSHIWYADLSSPYPNGCGTSAPIFHVGEMIFNNDYTNPGHWKSSTSGLVDQGDYFWDYVSTHRLYLWSQSDPHTYYSHIEAHVGYEGYGTLSNMRDNDYLEFHDLNFGPCGWHGLIMGGYSSVGQKVLRCDFEWNGGTKRTTEHRDGNGIMLYDSASEIEIAYCTFHDIWEKAISFQTTLGGNRWTNAYIHHNLMWDCCGGGFETWLAGTAPCSITNLRFAHNVIYNMAGSVRAADRWEIEGTSNEYECVRLRLSNNVGGLINSYIVNNIFHTPGYHFTQLWNSGIDPGSLVIDYNCYYPNENKFRYTTTDNVSFANWKSYTGDDSHSFAGSDPLFVNAAAHDFRLASTSSPCYNAGMVLSGVGQVPVGAPDIGAYEYAAGPQTLYGQLAVSAAGSLYAVPANPLTFYGQAELEAVGSLNAAPYIPVKYCAFRRG
jgi:hypothetical protein